MKRIIYLLTLLCLWTATTTWAEEAPRKKVAVVLSGGGAKGAAHIGALKVIEEAGIPIDYVVGTSMGSIIGGLYSIGYSTEQMDSLIRSQDWVYLLTDGTDRKDELLVNRIKSEQYTLSIPFKKTPKDALKGGLVQGRNLARLFSQLTEGYQDSISFSKLPTPFACVAHNLVDGSEYVFHSGKLALAMRSSMSIPGVFQPVHWNGMVLVDGGLSNNYPVDIARQMGADIVIGVDVQEDLAKADKLNTLIDVVNQIVDLMVQNKYHENVKASDLHIKVPASDYSAASFSAAAIDTLINRGEESTRAKWDSLLILKKKIGLAQSYQPKRNAPRQVPTEENVTMVPEIDPGKKPANSINVGVRFDNESLASIIFNSSVYLNDKKTQNLALTIRLGRKLLGRLDYTLHPFSSKWEINTSYDLSYNDLELYQSGDKICTYSFVRHLADFNIARSWHDIRFSLGARYENFHFKDFLMPLGYANIESVENEHFFIYYGQMQFDSYNKRTYPTSGLKWSAACSVYTDNMVKFNNSRPVPVLALSIEGAIPLRNRTTLLPWACSRTIFAKNNEYSFPMMNVIGGNTPGKLLDQQMPFVGIDYMQLSNTNTIIGGLKLRQRMGANQYLTAIGNVGFQKRGTTWDGLFAKHFWGAGVSYGYDTFLGPLEATLSYSNITKKLGYYISLGYTF